MRLEEDLGSKRGCLEAMCPGSWPAGRDTLRPEGGASAGKGSIWGTRAFTLEAPGLETYHLSLLFLLGYSGFLSGRTEREVEHGQHSELGKGGPLSSTC